MIWEWEQMWVRWFESELRWEWSETMESCTEGQMRMSRDELNSQFSREVFKLSVFEDFEGSLAQKLCFHTFTCQLLREVLHESFGFTSWSRSSATRLRQWDFKITCCFWLFSCVLLKFIYCKGSRSYTFFLLWRLDLVLEQVLARRSLCLANLVLSASATWCLQIALEWLRDGCSALLLRT